MNTRPMSTDNIIKLILVNVYPTSTAARYMLSSYLLKAFTDVQYSGTPPVSAAVVNVSNTTSPEKTASVLLKYSPDIIGYSCYIWNIEQILEVMKIMKKQTSSIQIAGGPEITVSRIHTFPASAIADYYIIGEGESTLVDLIYRIAANDFSKDVPGIAVVKDGQCKYTPKETTINELDNIPSIYLTGTLPERLYAKQQSFIETQRGCTFRCNYCVYPKFVPKVYYYSLGRIKEEFFYLIIEKQIKSLRIFDANFLSDKERAKDIVRYLLEMKTQHDNALSWIYWEFMCHDADNEFLALVSRLKEERRICNTNTVLPMDRPQHYADLLEGYCAINCIGIQSFLPESCKAVRRPWIRKESFKDIMEKAETLNIVFKIDIILGLPFETLDSYFAGLDFALPFFKNVDHIMNIHRLQILPGSELENRCKEYGITSMEKAPHTVLSSNTMDQDELEYASLLTAFIFRVINSPLRGKWFFLQKRKKYTTRQTAEYILELYQKEEGLAANRLLNREHIDDDYWNNEIFKDVPTDWLMNVLEG